MLMCLNARLYLTLRYRWAAHAGTGSNPQVEIGWWDYQILDHQLRSQALSCSGPWLWGPTELLEEPGSEIQVSLYLRVEAKCTPPLSSFQPQEVSLQTNIQVYNLFGKRMILELFLFPLDIRSGPQLLEQNCLHSELRVNQRECLRSSPIVFRGIRKVILQIY